MDTIFNTVVAYLKEAKNEYPIDGVMADGMKKMDREILEEISTDSNGGYLFMGRSIESELVENLRARTA